MTWQAVQTALGGGRPVAEPDVDLASIPDGIGAVVTTSGSTGAGKRVLLSVDALLASARATTDVLGPATWTCPLPTSYVAGLMTFVRAFVSGTQPQLAQPDLSDLNLAPGRNAISLVATQLHRAMEIPALVSKLGAYEAILVGGSAISASLVERARAAGLAITLTYGMSETCGGCVYDGRPLPNVDVRTDPAGRIHIRGPHLFSGYLGDPQASASVLVDEWFLTSDRGVIDDAGTLRVLGRLDNVVITGGVNVDLDEVTRVLAEEPIKAAIVDVDDPEWGVRLVLVAEPGRTLDQWRAALRGSLAPAALPKELVEVARLSESNRGKLNRAALRERAGGSGGHIR